jgi:hypothetical protein
MTDYENAYIVKHEIGHNHNGNHSFAVRWHDGNCPCWKHTIMNATAGGDTVLADVFSDGTIGGAALDNVQRMRSRIGWWGW